MKILYFALLKESLKLSSEEIILATNTTTAQLKKQLIDKHGEHHFPNNVLCAVNQEIANDAVIISETDEVAFYPPVTGG
ncbi:molybdenum cofactor biosynthesis protein D [Abyssogena phaseoliformis symbiont OG214]|uniref:molybdopterin converting factor subunit 1 n=1 Tax=Abyssogena phaseoliformis symbiont TaxID=596095 RepID=UPI00191556C6|nr:molybdopterin converting factor subunit 1 [Abyssogena phaseoliformis symbiont]MBW5288971.1 Molybdenum cofactor biosynthesis protein MoaD [Candidatus Ruthia sp. Apha_13_S6]BBB22830.1 molybdenum cofactor biosynthesis protein D [Abyssogena phaseoliformis symbiont OG214]